MCPVICCPKVAEGSVVHGLCNYALGANPARHSFSISLTLVSRSFNAQYAHIEPDLMEPV